ncbi:MAG TPA: hypothetical protein VLL97_03525 [Acidobacteriota bacterium]|nr:hypothetical protein [Acidobacteriota bacterium]
MKRNLFAGCLLQVSVVLLAAVIHSGSVAFTMTGITADEQYNIDYDRVQEIIAITQPAARAQRMVDLFKDRKGMDRSLQDYVDHRFIVDLEALSKQGNHAAVKRLGERVVELRPLFGEVYFFYGMALRQEKLTEAALNAFAKGHLIRNIYQERSKQQLDLLYRNTHGSLVGIDKVISQARKELQ